ncbi:MAG: hypothetical protein ABJL55_08385 [Roseibium sp.]
MTIPEISQDQAIRQGKTYPEWLPFMASSESDDDTSETPEKSENGGNSSTAGTHQESKQSLTIREAFKELDPEEQQSILEHIKRMIGDKS